MAMSYRWTKITISPRCLTWMPNLNIMVTQFKVISDTIKSSKITEVFFETFNELNSLPYESCSKSNKTFQLGVAQPKEIYKRRI